MVKDAKVAPSYFRCPISLEVMKSPVSLCTGVTYDRSSIQRWLDSGNNTCPATMQLLQSKDLLPNHTLHRLIQIWSAQQQQQQQQQQPPAAAAAAAAAANQLIINQLEIQLINNSSINSINQTLSKLISFAGETEENAKCVGVLQLLIPLIAKAKDLTLLEKLVIFCCNVVLLNNRDELKTQLGNHHRDFNECMIYCLSKGRLELRIAVVKLLDLMAAANAILEMEDEIYYTEVLRLIVVSSSSCNWNSEALDASLSLLLRLVSPKRNNRSKLVKLGGVRVLATLLSRPELSAALLTEKALKLIEMMSGCKEGRNEICVDEICLKSIVKKVFKVSNLATEHSVTVLWSLCCLFRDKRALAAVSETDGTIAKILVLLQTNCSPLVRHMCRDLLRVFKRNAKISCLSCYDTKTTHIMPF